MPDYGRETVVFLEIDQPMCTLHYGEFPCTAELGVTGTKRCFRTPATCQDIANIELSPRTLRFARKQHDLIQYGAVIPSLVDHKTTPAEINISGMDDNAAPLGRREVVSVQLEDHRHSDNIVDLYRINRIEGIASIEDEGAAQGGGQNFVLLRNLASGEDEIYEGMEFFPVTAVGFEGGTFNFRQRTIGRYDGELRKATVFPGWIPAYLRLPGVVGNYASTPDSVAVSITGDIDIRCKVAPNDWTPVLFMALIAKMGVSTPDWSYRLGLNSAGTLRFSWNEGGTFVEHDSTVSVGAADGAVKWVRATLDVNNGAAGSDTKFYTSDDGLVWTQLGATVTRAGVSSIADTGVEVEIGSRTSGTADVFAGKFYYAEIRNGIDGTVVAKFDPANDAGQGDMSFTSSTGEVWTLHQA